jgi:basic amino acid/polyamine antiporter, APA family
MAELARKLRTTDYFTLGFGTMVGVGWLVVMDDWLRRGGPLGAMLGFAVGGAILLPIGYVYSQLVMVMPDAASEIAYTARAFRREISHAAGWMMMLAYLVVCPWEAVAIGKIAAYIFPQLNSVPLYRVSGQPIYLPNLLIGLLLTAVITIINYRGIRLSATFQNWTTFGLLGLFVLFGSFGLAHGSHENLMPLFSHRLWVSIVLVMQIVPYFMVGFESIPKCAEESNPAFRSRGFLLAIMAAIVVGILFYIAVIAVVAYVYPWQPLVHTSFATAFAFERALGGHWIVDIILSAALLSLLKVFNGNFLAASRLLFALGRRGLVDERVGRIHERNRTPSVAVAAIGLATAAAIFLGSSILIPITEVGSMAAAFGWLATCAAYLRIESSRTKLTIGALGLVVAALLVGMKLFPFIPGHFSKSEWVALCLWIVAGILLRRRELPLAHPAGE